MLVLLVATLFPGTIALAPEPEPPKPLIQIEVREIGALGLPKRAPVEDGFFDDTLFIGDSVTKKLELYVREKRKSEPNLLGNARFYSAASLGSGNLQNPVSRKSIHPKINGQKMLPEDAVVACGAKKLYIYVQSVTPRLKGYNQKMLNNANIERYNQLLCETIESSGLENIWFLDVASVFRGADGSLQRAYCSDPHDQGIHFTDAACDIWIEYLYTHTANTDSLQEDTQP